MRILVNYDKAEQAYISVLQHFVKKAGMELIATSSILGIGELIAKAQMASCTGIFLCNAATLKNCVPDQSSDVSLDDWRGSLLNFSIPCIVGNSLTHTQTVSYGSFLLEKDLSKLSRLHSSFKPKVPEFSYTILESVHMFFSALEDLKKAEFLAYDVETKTINVDEENLEAGNTIITCCAWTAVYADRSLKTYVLPLVNFLETHWTTDQDYKRAISFMKMANALEIPKVMHNGMYDCMHSIIYNAEPNYWVLDTMAMMHSEYSELPKDLSFVASLALDDYCQWKSEASAASKYHDIQRYWAYNAKDTYTTARICLYYLDKLPAYAKANYRNQFKLVYPALYCNFEGFLLDQEVRKEIRQRETSRLESNLKKLRTMVADPIFNPGSYKQVGVYVYDVLGAVDPRIGTKKNAEGKKVKQSRGTDEKNLQSVGSQHPILLRVTDAVINYREAVKAVSTYMDFLQYKGRLLWNLNPFGTETGRMACQASSLWCGAQVQNIPQYAKGMLVADEGFELAEVDNSQSEARCTAYVSQDLKLIAALEDKEKDFYKTLGTLFFAIPYEKVSTEFRNTILKKIVHGTNYMMGAQTFIENAGTQNVIDSTIHLGVKINLTDKPTENSLTLNQYAQKLLDSYHIPFFRVREWYQEVKNEIISTKMLRSPLGHVRYFFGNVERNRRAFNSAVAHVPQNLSVSILNIGLWKVWGLVKKYEGKLRLKAQVHDSILFQYYKGRDDIRKEVIANMKNPVKIHDRTLVIPVDCKTGNSWGTMEKLPNE